jgi:hypothetical protein
MNDAMKERELVALSAIETRAQAEHIRQPALALPKHL